MNGRYKGKELQRRREKTTVVTRAMPQASASHPWMCSEIHLERVSKRQIRHH